MFSLDFPSILGCSLDINPVYIWENSPFSLLMWGGPQVSCITGPLPLNYVEVVIATPKLLDVRKKKAPPKKLWREQPQVRSPLICHRPALWYMCLKTAFCWFSGCPQWSCTNTYQWKAGITGGIYVDIKYTYTIQLCRYTSNFNPLPLQELVLPRRGGIKKINVYLRDS